MVEDGHNPEPVSFVETDPHGNSPHTPGAKLDAGKVPAWQGLTDYFPRACLALAELSGFGAEKYEWKGWESVPDGINRYRNAAARHGLYEAIEGPFDDGPGGTGALHLTAQAWNLMASLELTLRAMDPASDENETR